MRTAVTGASSFSSERKYAIVADNGVHAIDAEASL
jgi:hypothetical protein